jgi:hypothetical protein
MRGVGNGISTVLEYAKITKRYGMLKVIRIATENGEIMELKHI